MSNEIKKPREWWIKETLPSDHVCDVFEAEIAIKSPDFSNPIWNDFKRCVHVVEYSALEAAQADLITEAQAHIQTAGILQTRVEALEARETELLNLVMEMHEALQLYASGKAGYEYDDETAKEALKKIGVENE